MFTMCVEDSSIAPVAVHEAPIHSETCGILPYDRQPHWTFGLTCHRAPREDYAIILQLELC